MPACVRICRLNKLDMAHNATMVSQIIIGKKLSVGMPPHDEGKLGSQLCGRYVLMLM